MSVSAFAVTIPLMIWSETRKKKNQRAQRRQGGEQAQNKAKKKASIYILAKLVTPSGIEPELPPWKGGVLTAWPWSLNKNRQRPTFPGSFPPSIIGAKELNYCVRDGNRCDLLAIVTGFSACGFSRAISCLRIFLRSLSYFVPWKLNKSIKLVRKPLVKFSTY